MAAGSETVTVVGADGSSVVDRNADGGLNVHITNGAAGGSSQADKSAFTEGTSSGTVAMGDYNETLGADPTEDQAVAIRATAKRAMHVNIRDVSGNEVTSFGGGPSATVAYSNLSLAATTTVLNNYDVSGYAYGVVEFSTSNGSYASKLDITGGDVSGTVTSPVSFQSLDGPAVVRGKETYGYPTNVNLDNVNGGGADIGYSNASSTVYSIKANPDVGNTSIARYFFQINFKYLKAIATVAATDHLRIVITLHTNPMSYSPFFTQTMVEAQPSVGGNPTNMQTVATATGAGTTMGVRGFSTASFGISGSFVGTVAFECQLNGSWVPLQTMPLGGAGQCVTQATAAGDYIANVAGVLFVRANITAYTSGTITVIGNVFKYGVTGVTPVHSIFGRPSMGANRTHLTKVADAVAANTTVHTVTAGKIFYVTAMEISAISTSAVTAGKFRIRDNGATGTIKGSYNANTNTGSVNLAVPYPEPKQFATDVFIEAVAGTWVISATFIGYEE